METATKKKYSPVTGKMEPYVPKKQRVCQYLITFTSVALLVSLNNIIIVRIIFQLAIIVLATFGVMVYRVTVKTLLAQTSTIQIVSKSKFRTMIASLTGALMSGVFILIFKAVGKRVFNRT